VAVLIEVRMAVFVEVFACVAVEAGKLVGEKTGFCRADTGRVKTTVAGSVGANSTWSTVPAVFPLVLHAIIPGTSIMTNNRLRKTDNQTPSGYIRLYADSILYSTRKNAS
jgi:hypothetical protein